jgi:ParB family chromosome partitioning protein
MTATDLPVQAIEPNPDQPRKSFPESHIKRLAESIRRRGLIQPISVRPIAGRRERYMIVAGECRWRAHVLLGAATIRAIVEKIDDHEMRLRAIVENLQREDMNAMEEAQAFQALRDEGLSVAQIVEELGFNSINRVQHRLDLLLLLPEIQTLVASGNLASSMAWGIAQAPRQHQMRIVRDVGAGKLRTTEQVRHAGIALREAAAQLDAFAALPKPSARDLKTVVRLEEKIGLIVNMVAAGFKDGECVAAQRVAPDRVKTMADKLSLIRKHVYQMEHALRCVLAQTEITLEKR